jgi:hypothetical protein
MQEDTMHIVWTIRVNGNTVVIPHPSTYKERIEFYTRMARSSRKFATLAGAI